MEVATKSKVSEFLNKQSKSILKEWLQAQLSASTLRSDLISSKELEQQSSDFLNLLIKALASRDALQFDSPEYKAMFVFLKDLSSGRVLMGFNATETATFIFSLKQPLFSILAQSFNNDAEALSKNLWEITQLIDKLGMYTFEEFQKSREKIIKQQQNELLELSTPVTKLWEGILMLPLIGTLDSARTQLVMENLLQKIVETSSTVAIIDITGIPTVDTLVAQHLIKTTNAARLMGAECIISGIRPQIAQTIIHLGISLTEVITKATLADALELAMKKANFTVNHSVSR